MLGVLLGVGVLLAVSPVLWPAHSGVSEKRTAGDALRERLAQAGLQRVSAATFVAASILLAAIAGAVTFALVPVTALAVAAAIVGLVLPMIVVLRRGRSVRKNARVVWPDVVDHLVSAVRSGLSLPESIMSLAHTGPPATRTAFATFERGYRSSGDFAGGLDNLKAHLADPVADRILETVRMSREVGGSELTLVLRNLAAYLRQDAAIRSEVEARQSWVLNAARLGVAAPWIVLVLLATRPEAAAAYNTPAGAVLVVGGLGVSVVAYQIMIGLGRIPEERRWFR
jgi:tight adherence protein B